MDNTRRDFIKSAAMASVCAVAGCSRQPDTPIDLDMKQEGLEWVKSVCRFCGTGLRCATGCERRTLGRSCVVIRSIPRPRDWFVPKPCSCPRSSIRPID